MTRGEVARLVAMLMQAYPDAQTGPKTSELYERELADIDGAIGLAAVKRIIRTSKWFPKVSEIRGVAAALLHGPTRLGGEAWGDVIAAISRFGSYRTPGFQDPLVKEIVRMLGWQTLCRGENEAADRARFIEIYDGLVEKRQNEILATNGLPVLALPPTPRLQGLLERVARPMSALPRKETA